MKFLSVFLFVLLLAGCDYVPKELDGKVLCDKQGNCYKLEYDGEYWRFLVPVKLGNDSTVVWYYIQKPQP